MKSDGVCVCERACVITPVLPLSLSLPQPNKGNNRSGNNKRHRYHCKAANAMTYHTMLREEISMKTFHELFSGLFTVNIEHRAETRCTFGFPIIITFKILLSYLISMLLFQVLDRSHGKRKKCGWWLLFIFFLS